MNRASHLASPPLAAALQPVNFSYGAIFECGGSKAIYLKKSYKIAGISVLAIEELSLGFGTF